MIRKNMCAGIMLLVCTQSFCYPPVAYYRPSLWQSLRYSPGLKTGIYLGAAIAVGYGIYKWWGWWSNKCRLRDDRKMVADANKARQQAEEQYGALYGLLEEQLNRDPLQTPEAVVQQASQILCPPGQVVSCNAIINERVIGLGTCIASLDQRYNSLGIRAAQSQIRVQLENARMQLQTAVGQLRPLHGFLSAAKPLLILQALRLRHQDEIAGMQQAGDNIPAQWEALRPAIMRYQMRHHDLQAYLRYGTDLADSINAVPSVNNYLSHAALQAYQVLQAILNRILNSNEYHEDQRARELACQRQRELEVQQSQARAAAEQARAAQMRATAEQQKARAQSELAYERRRERQRKGDSSFIDWVHDLTNPL